MTTVKKSMLPPMVAAVSVVALFLVLALVVNGTFPVPIAAAIALVLGAGTFLSMRPRR
jgi:hypothetical protein